MNVYTPITREDRLHAIMHTNPIYGQRILLFIAKNPEFSCIAHLFPLTDKMLCFNKSTDPKCVFEFLLYYVAEAGVNANYGIQQWLLIKDHIRANHDNPFCGLYDLALQPKKVQVYKNIAAYLLNNNIAPYSLTLDGVLDMKKNVKGVGDGCATFMCMIYDTTKVTLPDYSEIGFKKGFQKFYKLDHRPTKKEVMDKAKGWSDVYLVNVLMQQVFRYM